ncbi:glycoside hydrolase family 2 protein [Lentithecium fluviatile CBS 122367]|uniref:Glycoside hydrolase family 2 protein n=1 Tax=Lentithecium fluviatile CBS 122367 TaxID=1168545 RepID=A0A6G1J3L0_9PLEO|nr:glycoside hydrolase family 2 protein [Lentithecium fluviatile CBS 122367]
MAPSFSVTLASLLLLTTTLFSTTTIALAPARGQLATIPSWKVQSSAKVGNDAAKLSSQNVDTSGWYTIGSKATLMSTLLENKVYTESDLFYSNNFEKVDYAPYQVPWFYRAEIKLKSTAGSHFQLKTHGISSRADLYLNGELIAEKNVQAGAYGGLTYDITSKVKSGKNVLLARAFPTDYNRDFALGFVDWNPYPPDNGTGVWRDVEIKETGPVSMSLPRVTTKLDGDVSVKLDVKSYEDGSVQGEVICTITGPDGKELGKSREEFKLANKSQQKLSLDTKIPNPQPWWPKQWGAQPLYSTTCTASTSFGPSDSTPKIRFGIRTITSTLNTHNDTAFSINNKPFQVLGAGYTSDIFLRFNEQKLRAQFHYMLDMGLNTVRLEGKQEHPRLYEIADELGLMVMTGWECCDKWEGWSYNDEGSGEKWMNVDYGIANVSMRHEAEMMQHHPSLLTFLVGSDFWPDDRAVQIYVDALKAFDWQTPIIASASQRGFPTLLGNGGMKMDGPYDWVPPNYWYADQLGAAFGFGSELGAGVGTPTLSSLKKFLSPADQDDLWEQPKKGLYHMSTNVSSFYTREIYNDALWKRYGAPTSLPDYLLKAQMMDYEATRTQFEAYASRWTGVARPATGLIYWMLNNAWPSLHWNLFDYYLHPAGSYFGTKVGSRIEHVAFDYITSSVYLINRSLSASGARTIDIEVLAPNGTVLQKSSTKTDTMPNSSKKLDKVPGVDKIKDIAFLKLVLREGKGATGEGKVLSRNVYWLSAKKDVLNWDASTWYYTPVSSYADYSGLSKLEKAKVDVKATGSTVVLENTSKVPAVFISLSLVDGAGEDIVPVMWEDNYVTLWPGEKLELSVQYATGGYGGAKVQVTGKNVDAQTVSLG